MFKLLVFVPEEFYKIGGLALPLNKYLPYLKENYDTSIFEIPYRLRRKLYLKEVLNKINRLELQNHKLIILSFGLNVTINVGNVVNLLAVKNVILSKIAFLFDSLYFSIVSTIEFNKKNNIKTKNKFLYKLKQINYYKKENYILHNWDKVILVSLADISFVKETYKDIYSDIFLIQNGIDFENNNPSNYKLQNFSNKSSDKLIKIGYLGVVKNNFDWFLDNWWPKIVSRNSNLKLVIAGRSSTLNLSPLYMKKQKNVEFIGEITNLSNFYSQCDIIIAALRKSSGILNKVLEAFAFKVPVIGLPNNFLAFFNARNNEHYVSFTSPEDFLSKLEWMLAKKHYEILRDNAFNYVKRYHRWENALKKLDSLIQ